MDVSCFGNSFLFCRTEKIVLKQISQTGPNFSSSPKDGVYEWLINLLNNSSPIFILASVQASLLDWHNYLGHPSLKKFSNVVHNFKLSVTSSFSEVYSCSSYKCNKMQ